MLSRLGAPQLIVSAAALLGLGVVMVYSASAIRSHLAYGDPSVLVSRQLVGVLLGGVAALVATRVPLTWLRQLAPAIWVLGGLALAATLTPLGVAHNGARRWLEVGGVAFQPLELAKLGVVIGLAWWCAGRRLEDWRASIAIPGFGVGVPALLLLAQPDFGGALMLLALGGVMVFVAGARFRHLAAAAICLTPPALLLAFGRGYRATRMSSFLNPFEDPLGGGYQLVQSLLSFGAGGITGIGLGAGQQKLGYLPEAHTDFILSVVGEELGLVGVAGVLSCLALLALAALAIASRGRDAFALLVATGAGAMLWLQGLVNAGVAMGVLPTKGTTLPLFSYGRSSLVASLIALGLILNVAQRRRSEWG